jgi:hypothetical protein
MTALIGSLQDAFATDTLAANWPASYGGAAVTGGQLAVPCTTGYAAGQTASAYTVNGSQVVAQVTTCARGAATVEAYTEMLVLSPTAGTDLGLHYNAVSGQLSMILRVGYVDADQLEVTYDAVAHRWWRVRVTGGQVFWDTSPDGRTWQTYRSATAPAWVLTGTTLSVNLGSRRNDGTPDTSTFDNFNTLPVSHEMASLTVEVGLGSGASTGTLLTLDDAARGKLDTATLAAGDVFTDVTAYVLSLSTHRGSSRVDGPIVRYEAGTATVVFANPDRRFDPTNLSGPYTGGGVTQIVPMVPVRIRASFGGVTYDLLRGYADNWSVAWSDPNWSTVTMTASDAFKVFANYSRPAVAAVGASELSGARISRILDSVSWPAADRVIATGNSTLQATTLEGDALAELQLAADSELGECYVDGAGRVVFRNRLALLTDTRSSISQCTFGDGGGSELPGTDVGVAYDDTQLVNYARVTRVGGVEQSAVDTASQQTYLTRTYERSDLIIETDSDALNLAQWVVSTSKDPELRFNELSFNPRAADATLWPQALGREIGDRITVVRRPPGGGSAITRDVFIRGISHEATASTNSWKTVWSLQSGLKGSFLTLDNSTLGVLDSNSLAY